MRFVRYRVMDDPLPTPHPREPFTIVNILFERIINPLSPLPDFLVLPVTSGSVDHRYPSSTISVKWFTIAGERSLAMCRNP